MSSRKEIQNHNMFNNKELKSQQNIDKEIAREEYALDEKMTIPNFDNKINKDSAWSQRKLTR